MKKLFRRLRACWYLLRCERYALYTSEDKIGNLHRWFTTDMLLIDDLHNMHNWADQIEAENQEASAALDGLLNLNPGIAPAE